MEPDIPPMTRMSAVDVASLAPVEHLAILVLLAGHEDPVVADAVVRAAVKVLGRTRGGAS